MRGLGEEERGGHCASGGCSGRRCGDEMRRAAEALRWLWLRGVEK